MSKREESIRSKKEAKDSEEKEKKEIRDVSVGAPDTKESGCQTRESLFQTDTAPSSDGEYDVLLFQKVDLMAASPIISNVFKTRVIL